MILHCKTDIQVEISVACVKNVEHFALRYRQIHTLVARELWLIEHVKNKWKTVFPSTIVVRVFAWWSNKSVPRFYEENTQDVVCIFSISILNLKQEQGIEKNYIREYKTCLDS